MDSGYPTLQPCKLQCRDAYLPPGAGPLLLLVPGPTLPELEGFAAADPLVDFMLAPVVVIEWCFMCLCDFACAAIGEPTNPAIANAPIANLNFVMMNNLLGEMCSW